MLFTTLLLASAPFFATAQLATPTISLPGLQLPTALPTAVPGGDLLGLVGQLPSCALGCLDDAAGNINCTTSDLTCLCSKSSELVGAIGPCLLLSSDCSSNETNTIGSVARSICSDVTSSNSSELADASRFISSALASATAGGSSSSGGGAASASGAAALRAGFSVAGVGILGLAAGVAVMAL